MGIRLVPKDPSTEEQHYCYAEWDEIHKFIKEHCNQLFTKEEITRAYLSDGLTIPAKKATEMSLLLTASGLITTGEDSTLNRFHKFCSDSKGFKIV